LQRPLSALNRLQAEIPEACGFFQNALGTAPGLHFKLNTCLFYVLPGVPYEMKALFNEHVLPELKSHFKLPLIKHITVVTGGIAESKLAELLDSWEQQLPLLDLKLAYLPRPGQVRLRISGSHTNAAVLNKRIQDAYSGLMPIISPYVIGHEAFEEEGFSLAQQVLQQLKIKKLSISIAESCTGGQLSAALTAIPGASEVFKGACVPYNNSMKQQLLKVNADIFESQGAVSKACVIEMAQGCKALFKTDIAISVSGIAGPGGATAEKPVGLVWIGIALPNQVITERCVFGADRQRNIEYSVQTALRMVLQHI
jgi:nicotinamide-nucleotide amidase